MGDKMEKILLVEPNYRNKYPPIGLMKISTYYKNKGDFVVFHKGLLPKNEVEEFDKILITTLFTFDFEMCVQTIRYYATIVGIKNVFVGGIAATIMPEKFEEQISGIQILRGQLVDSTILGYNDKVNVDILELDYDILWDISYEYPAADSYFIYTTRGCPRKCSFCAVKTLEPDFYDCNNISSQIKNVDLKFGVKKNLLIMDNNILYSDKLSDSVNTLLKMGFGKKNNRIKKCNNMKFFLTSLWERRRINKKYDNLLARIKKEFENLKFNRISKKDEEILQTIVDSIGEISDEEWIGNLKAHEDYIIDFFERYHFHKITRYVDFNQGLDARLFDEEKAEQLGKLAIKPCRIAFDDLKTKEAYFDAMENAVKHDIKYFSNYLLYNYEDTPEELWTRLFLNIQFCKKYDDISLFSFPMKYASIEHTDRDYVGKNWNKKFLRAINVILNVTSGVVAKEEDFFLRAFGSNTNEFRMILTMPDDFIRFRDFFDEKGITQLWKQYYSNLSEENKERLIGILEHVVENPDILDIQYNESIDNILPFYKITKKKVENNPIYYLNLVNVTSE